jgi:hypothetical protein
LIFACILIGINVAFIRQPNKCFFTEGVCRTLSWTSFILDPIECLVDGLSAGCGNTRISLIKAQLASGVLMAISCLIYLLVYGVVYIRVSKSTQRQVTTASEAVMAPVYQPNLKQLPMSMSHHHQSYTISSHPYQGSVPVMMAAYPPQAPPEGNYMNYNTPNQYSIIYPQILNERF